MNTKKKQNNAMQCKFQLDLTAFIIQLLQLMFYRSYAVLYGSYWQDTQRAISNIVCLEKL